MIPGSIFLGIRGEHLVVYKAFLSYSRANSSTAKRLHNALDRYRVPKALSHNKKSLPDKLHPIFRDCTDLAGGGVLENRIIQALYESENLIVLCSREAAKSKWVDKEVAEFIRLKRLKRIFPVIDQNEPEGIDVEHNFFPPSLRGYGLFAADLREISKPNGKVIGDGFRFGKLKLIAGLLDVSLDSLVQRERQRQRQQTALLGISTIVFAFLAVAATGSAIVAERRRKDIFNRQLVVQAENLLNQGTNSFQKSMLLAVESMRRKPSYEAAQILHTGLQLLAEPVASFDTANINNGGVATLNEQYLVEANDEKSVLVKAVTDQKKLASFNYETPYRSSLASLNSDDHEWRETYTIKDPNNKYDAYYGGPGCQVELSEVSSNRISEVKPSYNCMFVSHVRFSFDSRYMILNASTASGFYFNQIIDLMNEKVILAESEDIFSRVDFSPDSQYIATQDNQDTIRVIDPKKNQTLWSLSSNENILSENFDLKGFTKSGKFLIVKNDSTVQLIEAITGRVVNRFNPGLGDFFEVSFNAESNSLATVGKDSSQIWDIQSGQEIIRLTHEPFLAKEGDALGGISRVLFSEPAQFITAVDRSGFARIWQIQKGGQSWSHNLQHSAGVSDLVFSPDSKYLATYEPEGKVYLWNVTNGTKLRTLNLTYNFWVTGFGDPLMIFSSDVEYITTASAPQRIIQVWDVKSGQEVANVSYVSALDNNLDFISDSPIEFEEGNGNKIDVVRKTDSQVIASIMFGESGKASVDVNSPQPYSNSGFDIENIDNTLFITESDSGQEVGKIIHKGDINKVTFSPDGSYMASASNDGTTKLQKLVSSDDLIHEVCRRLNRNFTKAEWNQFLEGEPYRETCS
ncbi:MAG: TIR domain-containing protein [Leptolyngbya sp. SIO3F4]|nr:TIR domain-containing protein [Leptolyngbya sp. SIO3F4]